MSAGNRFVIKRKDRDGAVDDVVLDSEGLTIGRLISNDLVLNHRTVSRTHAGLKEIGGEFWLFNFSESNGTSLNGQLVDKSPLADGDVFQIGPFLLLVGYVGQALSITVERQLEVQTAEGAMMLPVAPAGDEGTGATVLIRSPAIPGGQTITPGGTRRFEGSGLLSGSLGDRQQALDIFWHNRKREAGKIAEKTALHPRSGLKFGKAQFNWRPSLDLSRLWRKSYFSWGGFLVVVVSVGALVAYENAYSPGELSLAHAATTVASTRGIAGRENSASCSNCHGVTEGMQDKCIGCHTTKTFQPTIYDSHNREDIACSSCHSEHQGSDIRAALVSYALCSRCHNGVYEIRTGPRAGELLPVPHGGTVGYPVVNGKWQWKLGVDQIRRRGLPERWAALSPRDQFHSVHQQGRMLNRMSCADCHSAGARGDARFRAAPGGECSKCHGVEPGLQTAGGEQANCNTCHQQHGSSEDLTRLLTAASTDRMKLTAYLASLDAGAGSDPGARVATSATFSGIGSAGALRQNRSAFAYADSLVGGLPWFAWAGAIGALPMVVLAVMGVGSLRRRSRLRAASAHIRKTPTTPITGSIELDKLIAEAPPYPHPMIDPKLCIGCHACVEACPHDVLAIVNGIATAKAPDQCMEDTSCQVECPTNPKACIVINTNKKIPPRKVPERNQRLQTNVEGIYMIGDVSGVPLIKNAINEGAQVIDSVINDFREEGPNPNAEYDVAIVGIGPAGLSAAVIAKQRGLRYVALEQDRILSTIENYPAKKYVFFKPDTADARGGIPLPGPGEKKETIIKAWLDAMKSGGVQVHEEESCTDIKRENGCFNVLTERGKTKQKESYKARKVILAIGNRGTPMMLKVPGEHLKRPQTAEPIVASFCPLCGTPRHQDMLSCASCGADLPIKTPPEDTKVKYKLSDPADFAGTRCIVVGAGNSAVEAAVDLCGFKRDRDQITFTPNAEVTLVVRSDFKGDLKLGNKMNVYDCIDARKIKVFYRTEIKEIKQDEVVLMDTRSKKETARLRNDYVFALIGGEKPTKFLEGLGIRIG